jgi:cation diffusion facilitator CzcD-associated flavoprotein CzcO
MPSPEHVDVLIVGAGLSGIGAAHHLKQECPGRSFAILEARETLGGTWDLFRYPGIRSDSDMHTLGYRFKPWVAEKAIADGPAILEYVQETAREDGTESAIRFNHRVTSAAWSTADAQWTVTAERTDTGESVELTAGFVFMCSGYYRYDEGYTPDFKGTADFKGTIVHPQHWPQDLDYAGKRVVVIGSGATAVTLVPAMARTAQHVTMLQRSPTYIVSMPDVDPLAQLLSRLPARVAYPIVRWKNVALMTLSYQLSRRAPAVMKGFLRRAVQAQLPQGYDVDKHFKPGYDPWDQRLCLVPNGDLFRSIRKGKATVVTDTIDTFTESGIRLTSGEELEADVIVTATGLNLLMLGGTQLTVDGEPVRIPETMAYKGMMLSGVPNMAMALGYTNASWTLKCDLTCEYVCRLLNHMQAGGYRQCTPVNTDPSIAEEPIIDLASGYVLRSIDQFPKQGSREPWRLRQNYLFDIRTIRRGELEDGAMIFSNPAAHAVTEPVAAQAA